MAGMCPLYHSWHNVAMHLSLPHNHTTDYFSVSSTPIVVHAEMAQPNFAYPTIIAFQDDNIPRRQPSPLSTYFPLMVTT